MRMPTGLLMLWTYRRGASINLTPWGVKRNTTPALETKVQPSLEARIKFE